MCIYQIERIVTGEKYIGQTIDQVGKRWSAHCRPSATGRSKIASAIQKYGKDAFEFSVLEVCETLDQLNEREIFLVKKLNTISPNGYNLTTGGLSYRPTQEVIEKIKLSKKSLPKRTPEQNDISYKKTKTTAIEKYNRPDLIEIIKSSNSIRTCLKRLGFAGSRNPVFSKYIKDNNIDISHFDGHWRWSTEQILATKIVAKAQARENKNTIFNKCKNNPEFLLILKSSRSATECIKKLGNKSGGQQEDFWEYIISNNIDFSHFKPRKNRTKDRFKKAINGSL